MEEKTEMETFCGNLTFVKAIRQHWSGVAYSYLEEPRPDSGFMFLLNGEMRFETREKNVLSCRTGDVIFLPQGSYYRALFRGAEGKTENFLVNFVCDESGAFPQSPVKVLENAPMELKEAFARFVGDAAEPKKSDLRRKGELYLLLARIAESRVSGADRHEKILLAAREMLENEPALPISKIARRCAVSESGLRALFQKKYGFSPLHYRMEARLGKAAALLESTDFSVDQIADRLGFFDSASFCRAFKKKNGVSPKKYAQNKKRL